MFRNYFRWLQKDVPLGEIESYPEINSLGETSVKGIYVVGDLTGIPLLKLAAENGALRLIQFQRDERFQESRKNKERGVLDMIIIGAGPAGIAAGLEASALNYEFKILESSKTFNTILNFPKGKPIYAEPTDIHQTSRLTIPEGVKETLLENLDGQIKNKNLPILEGVSADTIIKKKDYFEIITTQETFKALRVILATGKSGNSRLLNVPGENLDKVFNRLIDPQETKDQDVLVVGGGDSALETAVAIADYAHSVTLSYRKPSFARPKEGNLEKFHHLQQQGKITAMMDSTVAAIDSDSVSIIDKNKKEIRLPNSMVFVQIGKQLPLDFFKKIGVKMEGVLTTIDKWMFFALLMFSGLIYFGKSGVKTVLTLGGDTAAISWSTVFANIVNPSFWWKLLIYPFGGGFFEKTNSWNWNSSLYGLVGYLCFIAFLIASFRLLWHFFTHRQTIKYYTATAWQSFKYGYFIVVALFFTLIYVGSTYFGMLFLGKKPGFWYTFLYSLTIVIFGLRRIHVKPTRYIKLQTWSLILIQVLPLFLLPEIILPALAKLNLLGGKEGFLFTQVFPNGQFWYAYRFILTWPLSIGALFTDSLTTFWLIYTILFTFGLIPYIVYLWGKGAFCGWICSCGALAETLGDEYRTLAPHGAQAKKIENAGQWVLAIAFLMTSLKLMAILGGITIPFIHAPRPAGLDLLGMIYAILVDVIFAGVLGVGVYFFKSGRVWCRFFCPLAALMHIYARFSRYRIFSEKKKCISCNICTKVCHMGIDVMNYANKGIPMNDVQCVRCSACVVHCPMECLYFGNLPSKDTANQFYKSNPIPKLDKSKWQQGMRE